MALFTYIYTEYVDTMVIAIDNNKTGDQKKTGMKYLL